MTDLVLEGLKAIHKKISELSPAELVALIDANPLPESTINSYANIEKQIMNNPPTDITVNDIDVFIKLFDTLIDYESDQYRIRGCGAFSATERDSFPVPEVVKTLGWIKRLRDLIEQRESVPQPLSLEEFCSYCKAAIGRTCYTCGQNPNKLHALPTCFDCKHYPIKNNRCFTCREYKIMFEPKE